jgi:hypothetical protein
MQRWLLRAMLVVLLVLSLVGSTAAVGSAIETFSNQLHGDGCGGG